MINSADCFDYNCKLLPGIDVNFYSFSESFHRFVVIIRICTEIKLLIDRYETDLTLESIEGPHDGHRSALSLVVNVLNDKTRFLGYVVVRTYVLIDLVHWPWPLGDVSTSFLENVLAYRIRSFIQSHNTAFGEKTHCNIVLVSRIPFWHQQEIVFPWLQGQKEINCLGVGILSINPPVITIVLFEQ